MERSIYHVYVDTSVFYNRVCLLFICDYINIRRPGFNPWVRNIPWRRKWQPTPVFWEIPWMGELGPWGPYTPYGHKELDTTERLHFHLHINITWFWKQILWNKLWNQVECVFQLWSFLSIIIFLSILFSITILKITFLFLPKFPLWFSQEL